jgi:hypothetical protein
MPSAINADNGVVSGTAGLKSSADSSGVLDLQTNGTTAISISASQVVTFANQPAYTGGTANGVLYLNGSKVVTTGSALTFDGSQLDIPLGSAGTPSLSTPTDPNTGMFFPAADTIAFAEGGVEAMRLDSSGNMGLGVTPAAWFTGGGYKVMQIGPGMAFDSGTDFRARITANGFVNSSGDFIYLNTGAASNYNQAGGEHKWFIAPSGTAGNAITFAQVMVLDSTGALLINRASNGVHLQTQVNSVNTAALGSFNGAPTVGSNLTGYAGIMFNGASLEPTLSGLNVRQSALVDIGSTGFRFKTGHFTGINFPATQAASSDANTLDDYEEGTWTPQMYFGGTLATASGATGRYVKIGRQVTVTGQYALSSRNSGTGSCTLRSFPFSNTGTNEGDRGGASVGYYNGFSSLYPFLMLDTGSTTATFRQGSGADFNDTNVGVGSSFWFSYSYITGA